MPKIHGCQISQRQIDQCVEPVMKIIGDAARAGAETPSFRVIIYALRAQDIRVCFAEMSAILYLLVDTGRLAREGRKHEVVYILPTGERTVTAPRGQNEKISHEPRHLMTDEEWMERHRDPETGVMRHYGFLHKRTFRPDPRYSVPLSGADGLGASSMHWR